MPRDYFHRVAKTGTQVWVNNPTLEDLEKSLEAGAINGTTNPAYGSKLLKSEPKYINAVIDSVVAKIPGDSEAADQVYQIISRRFMEKFLQLYESSGNTRGFVTMQDDPRRDDQADWIVEAALRHAKVSPNYMAKIPVIQAGMDAMAKLVELDMPICATEVFSVAQAVAMCDVYAEASAKTGKTPPFYLTHITGIYDEEIQAQVESQGIDISPELVKQAGTIVMRKQYRTVKERGYATTMLGGGARGPHHFTEWVGGDAHITINWSTFEELISLDPPIASRIDAADSEADIAELRAKVPDFRRAYDDDGLTPLEFASFAPLLRFRNNFIDGCDHVLREIAARRRVPTSA
jgi:transaldolase